MPVKEVKNLTTKWDSSNKPSYLLLPPMYVVPYAFLLSEETYLNLSNTYHQLVSSY